MGMWGAEEGGKEAGKKGMHWYSKLCFDPLSELTTFSLERNTPSFPNRTWKGEHWNVPSCCRTTMTSMHPERVA